MRLWRRVLVVVALPAVVLVGSTILAAPADAAARSCSGYQFVGHKRTSVGDLRIYHEGEKWCAIVKRRGSYFGRAGDTRVSLEDWNSDRWVETPKRISRVGSYAAKLSADCVTATGWLKKSRNTQLWSSISMSGCFS